jgi:hypothetical protein
MNQELALTLRGSVFQQAGERDGFEAEQVKPIFTRIRYLLSSLSRRNPMGRSNGQDRVTTWKGGEHDDGYEFNN